MQLGKPHAIFLAKIAFTALLRDKEVQQLLKVRLPMVTELQPRDGGDQVACKSPAEAQVTLGGNKLQMPLSLPFSLFLDQKVRTPSKL